MLSTVRAAGRLRGECGSALMLMPAAVLILVILGAVTVDSAIAWSAQRELANRAAAVANDVAAGTVDDEAFYRGGEVVLDRDRADELAAASTDAGGGLRSVEVVSLHLDGDEVSVTLSGTVRRLFAPAVGRAGRDQRVTATASATARGD